MKPKKNSATIVNGNLAIQVNLAVMSPLSPSGAKEPSVLKPKPYRERSVRTHMWGTKKPKASSSSTDGYLMPPKSTTPYPPPLPYPLHGVKRKIWDVRALDKALDEILDKSDGDVSMTDNKRVVSEKIASRSPTSLQESINARNASLRNTAP